MRACLAALALAMGWGASGSAEPLDCGRVPADAKWLVHVDVRAIDSGAVSQKISDLWRQLPATRQGLQRLRWTTGVDLAKDLEDITVYGRSFDQDHAVTIVRSKADQARLARYLRARPDFHTSEYRGHELMGWTERKGNSAAQTMAGCVHESRVWLFGRDVADLKLALDVLSGHAPSLPEGHALHATRTPEGTMIQVRGIGLGEAKLPFESPLVRKSTYLMALGGENATEVFVEGRVATQSGEVAGQLRSVVEGLLAMARLRFDQDPDMSRVLDAVKVSVAGESVMVQCRWPAEQLLSVIEKSWTKQAIPK